MVNKVILIGNLGRDPEIKRFDDNNAIARVTLATNESYMDKSGEWQKITDWHNVVLRGSLAERAEKYLHKGSSIYVEGKLKTRKYTDSNGVEKYTTEVLAGVFKILDKRDSDSTNTIYDSNTKDSESQNNSVDHQSDDQIDNQIDDLPF